MPRLSRRLLVFCAVFVVVLAAPLALAGFVAVRGVFTPPVAGTRFLGLNGPRLDGGCTDHPSTKGGKVLICNFSFHVDSRFAVVDHSSAAVGWCVQRVNDGHFEFHPPTAIGPLLVGFMRSVPPDWGNCTEIVPQRAGMFAEFMWKH
jgi:hypothetical protein